MAQGLFLPLVSMLFVVGLLAGGAADWIKNVREAPTSDLTFANSCAGAIKAIADSKSDGVRDLLPEPCKGKVSTPTAAAATPTGRDTQVAMLTQLATAYSDCVTAPASRPAPSPSAVGSSSPSLSSHSIRSPTDRASALTLAANEGGSSGTSHRGVTTAGPAAMRRNPLQRRWP